MLLKINYTEHKSMGGLGLKGPCDIQKKILKVPKIPEKGLFLDILYGRL
jgi:hypothetical protein